MPSRAIGRDTVCYDMAYGRGDTIFMRWAAGSRLEARYKGWGMLVEQAAEAFLLWHGVRPETRPVMGALERLIGTTKGTFTLVVPSLFPGSRSSG